MKVFLASALVLMICAASTSVFGYWCYDADDVYAEVEGSTITVYHDAAFYNCCPDSFGFDVAQGSHTITVDEVTYLTQPCFCMCCYNLSVEIGDVAPGDYTISFNWYDEEAYAYREWVLEVTVPDVGQFGALYVADVLYSGCLSETGAQEDGPEEQPGSWGRVKSLWR